MPTTKPTTPTPPTKPDEPQDGFERKAGLIKKVLEVIFGKGQVSWPRAAIAITLIASALVYVLATRFAPPAYAVNNLAERIARLEAKAIDPKDLKALTFAVGQTNQSVSRLECVQVGGNYATCLSRYPPISPPP